MESKGGLMQRFIINFIIAFAVVLLAPQFVKAQGTTYISNLGQSPAGSDSVGSDSWLASGFQTGNNPSGYVLDSVQLAMTDASGSPSGFTVSLYENEGTVGSSPGNSLGMLDGSANPSTTGVYTYADDASMTLSPNAVYFIVVTSATTTANGAYKWSYTSTYSYNHSGGWFGLGNLYSSSNGLYWPAPTAGDFQFAINATPIPEPPAEMLLGFGGILLLCFGRLKAKVA